MHTYYEPFIGSGIHQFPRAREKKQLLAVPHGPNPVSAIFAPAPSRTAENGYRVVQIACSRLPWGYKTVQNPEALAVLPQRELDRRELICCSGSR